MHTSTRIERCAILIVLLSSVGCRGERREQSLFELLSPSRTGVHFENTLVTTDSLNFQTDAYVYNGAGVAVGDIDNDGLPDIFFAGNQVTSRLYLNRGNFHFDDITTSAGVTTARWATGVTMVDINNDGFLDVYVSVSGPQWTKAENRANLLFINNGNRTFTESAAKYGIADTGFTTQAAFLDYNKDGCLDLFLLNNSAKDFTRADLSSHPSGKIGQTPGSYNELYRNNCNSTFTNVSREAGVLRDAGFGLGVAVADLNRDGWPDIYVSNDIAPNDVVYVNNGDGTFTNKRATWLKHTSYSGMGVDIADFNNDGWPDILQVDMLPHDLSQRKKMSGSTTLAALEEARRRGLLDDFTANALQLNNGLTKSGDVIFSDIAHMAGIASTDWSWSPLFADFDNDGYKDILITNGYPKAVNDRDYVLPATAVSQASGTTIRHSPLEMLKALYPYHLPNYVFRNRGDLTFADETKAWGMEQPSFSYGAAYVDLDNDGRLDIVMNNMNGPAFIYRNVEPVGTDHHFLSLMLVGDSRNPGGVGSNIVMTVGGRKEYLYQSPTRGYMSTVDDRPHFGLGRATRVDTLRIEWPDGRQQTLTNIAADRFLTLKQSDAAPVTTGAALAKDGVNEERVFDQANIPGLAYLQPSGSLDFSVQPLLPYVISSHGPVIAVADVNGDGLDDVFIGGGGATRAPPGRLFVQRKDGTFAESSGGQPWAADRAYEDWGAAFIDANGDGRPDLYVASGGYQLAPNSSLLQDRLYLNLGGGRFVRDSSALPALLASKGVVRVGDYNGDGRPDLFVAGRLTPRAYPYPTHSFILRNDGGHFTDVTAQIAPELMQPGGMVTDGAWVDFDTDGKLDLVTVGEWMPINFFRNDGKQFHSATGTTGLGPSRGWWYSLAVGDVDNDGRPDIVAGNLGLNYTYTTSKDAPFGVYAGDFTGNRSTDIILTKVVNGTEYPFGGLAPLGWQIYPLAIRYPTYGSFANATINEVLSASERQHAIHYQADTFASMYLHNDGGGKFTAHALPNLAQIAPIKSMLLYDVDGDGHLDIVAGGNLYEPEPNTPRADAGTGLWLRGDGRGHFQPVSPGQSGFVASKNLSSLTLLRTRGSNVVLVGNSGDSLQVFRTRKH